MSYLSTLFLDPHSRAFINKGKIIFVVVAIKIDTPSSLSYIVYCIIDTVILMKS